MAIADESEVQAGDKREREEVEGDGAQEDKKASHHEQRRQRRKVLHNDEKDAARGGSESIEGRSGKNSELNIIDTKVQHLLRKDTYDFSLSLAAFAKHNVKWKTREERMKSNPKFGKPPSIKEGMRANRREKWIEEYLKVDPEAYEGLVKELVVKLRNLPNIPWKRPAFNNFMKKQIKITDETVVGQLWEICDGVTSRTRHVNSSEAMAVELEKRRDEWIAFFNDIDISPEVDKVVRYPLCILIVILPCVAKQSLQMPLSPLPPSYSHHSTNGIAAPSCKVKSAIAKLRDPANVKRIPFRYEEFLPFLEKDLNIIEDKKDGVYKVKRCCPRLCTLPVIPKTLTLYSELTTSSTTLVVSPESSHASMMILNNPDFISFRPLQLYTSFRYYYCCDSKPRLYPPMFSISSTAALIVPPPHHHHIGRVEDHSCRYDSFATGTRRSCYCCCCHHRSSGYGVFLLHNTQRCYRRLYTVCCVREHG
jgi:hypothetical protein